LDSNITTGIATMKKCISQARKKDCTIHCNTVHLSQHQLSWKITEQIKIILTLWPCAV
jgi:hypothetical protein